MNAKTKVALGVAGGLILAAAFALYFVWFRTALPGRDAVLSLMPGNAQTVLFVDLNDLRQQPFFTDLLAWAPKPALDPAYDQFRRDTGFDYEKDLDRVFVADDLAKGENMVFCATGISDSALLRGVKSKGTTAITHSILMRAKSKTVRFIRATHNLQTKTIRLRSDNREHMI